MRVDPTDSRGGGTTARLLRAADAGLAPVWVQEDIEAPRPLQHVDTRTNRLVGAAGRGTKTAIAAHGDSLWTMSTLGVLERRDATSGRLLGRLDGFAGGQAASAIAADDGGVWVTTGEDGSVTRVTPDMQVSVQVELGARGSAHARRRLALGDRRADSIHARLLRLDPETGEVLGRLRLGARLPRALLAVGDEVWAVIGDGTVLVIR